MINLIKKFGKDEDGASLIEYSLLIGLISVIAVVAVGTMGTWVNTQWQNLITATTP